MCKAVETSYFSRVDPSKDFSNKELFFYKIQNKLKNRNSDANLPPNFIEKRLISSCSHIYCTSLCVDQNENLNKQKIKIESPTAQSVFDYVKEIQELLAEANLKRTEIDRVTAEALIEKDFLNNHQN